MELLATILDSVDLEPQSNFWPLVLWLYFALILYQELKLGFVQKGFSKFRFKAYLELDGETEISVFS